jgi:hypothetical protein
MGWWRRVFGSDGPSRAQADGLVGEATIRSLREGGPYVNERPTITMELDVAISGHERYRAQARQRVGRLVIGRLEPGATIPVRVDRNDLQAVVVDEEAMLRHRDASGRDPLAQLRQIVELRDAGALTEEEFAAKKAEILSKV